VALRVGIDLVSVDDVRESLRVHGRHYLRRVYTEREVADCSPGGTVDADRLAARFAAKEAAIKALRPAGEGFPLSAIEVRRAPEGWVDLTLSGAALELASSMGVTTLSVSVTHEAGFASAVVAVELSDCDR
jgi:holo-[acyl-carrier protein] synthase